MPVRCVIGDRSAIVVAGLRGLVESHGFAAVVGSVNDARSLPDLARGTAADLVLCGFEPLSSALRLIEAVAPAPLLAFTWTCSRSDVLEAIGAGVGGIVLKDAPVRTIGTAIDAVLGGTTPVPQLNGPNDVTSPKVRALTAREEQVAHLVAQGLTNNQVARRLEIAPQTVKNHVHNIMAKLDVQSRVEVTLWARGLAAVG